MILIDINKKLKLAVTILSLAAIATSAAMYMYIDKLTTEQLKLHQELNKAKEKINTDEALIKKQSDEIVNNQNTINHYKIKLQEYIDNTMEFEVTAYDLSVQSCGKSIEHPAYGVTATGFNLANHDVESARTIAVDPDVIPLGTKVKIAFKDEDAKQYNGIYVARDTGGAIVGNKIDLFMGDTRSRYSSSRALEFGVKRAKVRIIKE